MGFYHVEHGITIFVRSRWSRLHERRMELVSRCSALIRSIFIQSAIPARVYIICQAIPHATICKIGDCVVSLQASWIQHLADPSCKFWLWPFAWCDGVEIRLYRTSGSPSADTAVFVALCRAGLKRSGHTYLEHHHLAPSSDAVVLYLTHHRSNFATIVGKGFTHFRWLLYIFIFHLLILV
jgi:hypothetical protein